MCKQNYKFPLRHHGLRSKLGVCTVMRLLLPLSMLVPLSILCGQLGHAQTNTSVQELSRKLSIPVERLQDDKLRVLRTDAAVRVRELTAADTKRSYTLAVRTGSKATRTEPINSTSRDIGSVAAKDAFALPIKFTALAVKPGETNAAPVEFDAVVLIVSGLRFNESRKRFDGELAVGLRNHANPRDRSSLVEPVKLVINAAAADEIDPSPPEFEIRKLGDPVYVRLGANNPVTPFQITARTMLDEGDTIEMPISRPAVTVEPVRKSIEGWGLGKTRVQIQAGGLQNPGNFSVSLSTDRGNVTDTPIKLAADGRGEGELRSDGTGTATIRVTGNPMQPSVATVEFVAPWRFLLAATLGAIAGWYVRTRGRSQSIRSATVAIASAAILVAAYMIGIRWLQWAPEAQAGEALAFFVGAMGAYLGVSVLFTKPKG